MITQTSSVTVVGGMGPGVIMAPQIAPLDYCGLQLSGLLLFSASSQQEFVLF